RVPADARHHDQQGHARQSPDREPELRHASIAAWGYSAELQRALHQARGREALQRADADRDRVFQRSGEDMMSVFSAELSAHDDRFAGFFAEARTGLDFDSSKRLVIVQVDERDSYEAAASLVFDPA